MTYFKFIGKSLLNSTNSFVFIKISGLFNGFQFLEQVALLTPALIGVRAIFKSGGIRAGVKGAGVKKGPAKKRADKVCIFVPNLTFQPQMT